MKIFFALFFLGFVQGLTEFLPVSSSGHLVLISRLFGIQDGLFLSIILHCATLLSIFVLFYKDIFNLIRHPFSKETISLVVATIPTGLIAIVLMPFIKTSFGGNFLPICFLISALSLLLSETVFAKKTSNNLNLKTAFFMGVAQGFAVFPGISRSGSTIATGLICGGDKKEVAKFSFLMSIPIILLSLFLEVYEICVSQQPINLPTVAIIVSFLVAFGVGLLSIKAMIKLTQKSKLKYFSIYLAVACIVSLFVV